MSKIKVKTYRRDIYNLQNKTVTFLDQGELLEKIDLRYLKTLKTKKLNTKIPQKKLCPCSCIWPDLQNLQTRKKKLKKYLGIKTVPS